ncbi:MAG: hypothetical protein ABEJ92_06240 [Halobacteriales archaeon]
MADLGERLAGLLVGDFVRLEADGLSVTAEVVDNEVARLDDPAAADGHAVSFMPVGEAATAVDADRFHVVLEPAGEGGWRVGPLVADVFDEAALDYVSEPRGPLAAVERLDLGP